ncbi:MAG TPA: diguanylate cyclase [Bryobacteraceae bacterium]|nr:diguanylate cyclase [Bryobacteraceae bacterium]
MDCQELQVLLAEDDEDDYVFTRDLLREIPRMSFHLDWAPSYEEALESIECNRYDLCLLDYRLGPANGLQLLDAAIAHGCTAPIIFLTGLDDWETDFKVMQAGAADYLVKGQIDGKQLERSIRHAIERTQTQKVRFETTVEQLESVARLAETDALTGLGNRRKVERTIEDAIKASRPFSLLVFDMNGFKQVNDRYGHSQGDQLLKLVAQRMRDAVRDADVVCRWGGDEFVIVMPDTSLASAHQRAERIGAHAFGSFSLSAGGRSICVEASAGAGAAEYLPGETAAEFFERADQLLLENKRRSRKTPVPFPRRAGSSQFHAGRKAHRLQIR